MAETGIIENGIHKGKKVTKLNKGERLVLPSKEELPQLYIMGGFFSNEEIKIKLTNAVKETKSKKRIKTIKKETKINAQNDTKETKFIDSSKEKTDTINTTEIHKEQQNILEQNNNQQIAALKSIRNQQTQESDILNDIDKEYNYEISENEELKTPKDYSGEDHYFFDEKHNYSEASSVLNSTDDISSYMDDDYEYEKQNTQNNFNSEEHTDILKDTDDNSAEKLNSLKDKKKRKKSKEFYV